MDSSAALPSHASREDKLSVSGQDRPTAHHFLTMDGLRGIAAVCVMLFHANSVFAGNKIFPHAALAVDFFFILSGFVVAHAYEVGLTNGTMSFANYVSRRIQRLYPLIVLGALVGGSYWLLRRTSPFGTELVYILLAITALPWLGAETQPGGIAPVNSPAWSLFFELVANIFYGVIARWLRWPLLAFILLMSGAALTTLILRSDTIVFGFERATFFCRIFSGGVSVFLGGGALPCPLRARRAYSDYSRLDSGVCACRNIPATRIFAGAGLYEIFCVFLVYPVLVLLASASSNTAPLRKVMTASGNVSYPLYILHMPLFRWVAAVVVIVHAKGFVHGYIEIALAAIVAVVVSFAAFHLYDIPVRRWLGKLRLLGGARVPDKRLHANVPV